MAAAAVAAATMAGAARLRAQTAQPQATTAGGRSGGATDSAERGRYLVTAMGCGDCHTPWKMGASGPEPDASRLLSGHPQALQMPAPPAPKGPWMLSASATMTAWSGPWGVSHSANLTPDPETGLGKWTEQQFVDAIRSGRHMGRGRPILPPMPWPGIRTLNDDDLKAVFAYLRTIPAISNRVPDPLPPAAGGSSPAASRP